MLFKLIIVVLSWVSLAGSESVLPSLGNQGCRVKCGSTLVSYPFGMGSGCYRNEWFDITCSNSFNPAKPYLTKLNLEVNQIDLASQTVSLNMPMIFSCTTGVALWRSLDLGGTPFSFSRSHNEFRPMAGCNGSSLSYYEKQTMVSCGDPVCKHVPDKLATDDLGYETTPEGTCEVKRPPNGLTSYSVNITEANGTCNYVRLVQRDFVSQGQNVDPTPVVLNWLYDLSLDPSSAAYLEGRCNFSAYVQTGVYTCTCPKKHAGNPYLPNGCQEVAGCARCGGICAISDVDSDNVPLSYNCYDYGVYDPGLPSRLTSFGIILIIEAPILLLFSCYWLYRFITRWKEVRKKSYYFKRNGGLLLEQKIPSNEKAIEGAKVFTYDELDAATNHFNESRILGSGAQGAVYKGTLQVDGSIVAVKKSVNKLMKLEKSKEVDQFIKEMVALSKLRHRNIVKLRGCCLETEVPLLVYEYIPNGTLSQYIDRLTNRELGYDQFTLTWKARLQIAIDIAQGITYIHSGTSILTCHRDIKSSNILLDETYTAKVADFGLSKEISHDQTHASTRVIGTFGYFDPEYFQSNRLTEKSDVFSFGVVLVELLTGKTAKIYIYQDQDIRQVFLSSLGAKPSRLFEIVDPQVLKGSPEESIKAYSNLAKSCLHEKGMERPTMKQVSMVLEGIKSNYKHSSQKKKKDKNFFSKWPF